MRRWIVGIVGAAVIAAAVLWASEKQRSTAQTNFSEAQAAAELQIAILSAERGLDAYLVSGSPKTLQSIYEGKLALVTGLDDARELSSDDAAELREVADQAVAFRRWSVLATAAIAQRGRTGADDSPRLERQRGTIIDSFLAANNDYRKRLEVNRFLEERSAALLPVWLLVGLGAILAGLGVVADLRKRAAAKQLQTFALTQARFGEAIQFAENEVEAHDLLTQHLERTVPQSSVVVLNRNNSADRLEPTRQLADDDPRTEPLLASKPRTCLAVRLSRRYERSPADSGGAFNCQICGVLGGPSSCQPLLVGGEVIGSVLVAHREALSSATEVSLQESVAQAAPVLANLRNLAIAEGRAATDSLTGLPNRRSVDDTLRRMLAQADRAVTPFSVALLDLDHFKKINDNYGHDRGDDVLAAFASLLRAELRTSDFAGRSGGEEFVIFLPDTTREAAVAFAEKVRRNLRKLRVAGIDRPITTSIGIATFPDDGATTETLMRIADRALYTAKQNGRDRVEVSPVESSPSVEQAQLVERAS